MIYIFQRQLPAYRIAMFRYLSEELSGDLIVYTSSSNIAVHSCDNLGFAVKAVSQKDFWGGNLTWQNVIKKVDQARNSHKVSIGR